MSSSVFSLRLLPDNVRHRVIKTFDYLQLVSFSLISTKTKSLVESFNLNIEVLTVYAKESLHISIELDARKTVIEFYIYLNENRRRGQPLRSLDHVPYHITVKSKFENYEMHEAFEWRNPGLSFTQWFHHFCGLFNSDSHAIEFNEKHEIFDTVALSNLLPEWSSLEIQRASRDHGQKIIELFTPIVKNMDPGYNMNHMECPQEVMIQNFNRLTVFDDISLDDALAANASCITFFEFTVSNVNRFLRSWVRGSNPRLETAYIDMRGPANQNTLLRGITYKSMRKDLVKEWDEHLQIKGGIEIRNKKGVLAFLEYNVSNIRMYVCN